MKATELSKEKGVVKFSIEFPWADFEEALNNAYLANRGSFTIDGFRKGKAPRKIIESHYGQEVFYDEALNLLLQGGYYDAVNELGLDVISQPSIDTPEVKKDENIVITGKVEIFPEVEVKNYKNLEIEKFDTKIGDTEIQQELEKIQKSQGRMENVTDRNSQKGDTLIFDFDGSVDGVSFDGGKAENYELKLGSGQFIPGFEEQLEDKAIDEDVDVKVTFPKDYHAEDLAGKDAVFKCKVHEIKTEILPEIDDDLASDTSDFETLEELKKDLAVKLQKAAEDRDISVMKDRVLEKLYEENEVEVPSVMIDNELENMIYDMNQSLSGQGINLKQYLEWTGKTIEDMKNDARPEAEKRIRTRILLKNIIRMENLTADEKEVDEMVQEFANQYGMTKEQALKMGGENTLAYFKEDVQTKKAIDFIYDNAKKVEVEVVKMDSEQ